MKKLRKIINSRKINNLEVLTPFGYVDFEGIVELEETDILTLVLEDNLSLKCSYDHLLFSDDKFIEISAINLNTGDEILTKYGNKKILNIIKNDKKEKLYDLVNVKNNHLCYYTNDIASHNCFLGSSNTLIDYRALECLNSSKPLTEDEGSGYKRWEFPKPDRHYLITVDPSEGKDQDSHAIQVLDITSTPWEQVAVFHNKSIPLVDIPLKIKELAEEYNGAYILVENNAIGKSVVNDLYFDLNYDKIVRNPRNVEELGVYSNKGTKAEACGIMKKCIENSFLKLNDNHTIGELLDFGAKQGSYKGLNGPDDLVMSLAWACYFNTTEEFKSLGASNLVEWFNFKTGKKVIDDQGKFNKLFLQDDITELEVLKIVKLEMSTDEQELRDWLLS